MERGSMALKSVVTDVGELYTTYKDFAVDNGFPNAARELDKGEKRIFPDVGEEVSLLFKGEHIWGRTIWIIETGTCDQFIIGQDGLEFAIDTDTTRELLANLAAYVTKSIRNIEDKLQEMDEYGREQEQKVIRAIRSEAWQMQDRFGLSTNFIIAKPSPGTVYVEIIAEDGRVVRCADVPLGTNPYLAMYEALSKAVKRAVSCEPKRLPLRTNYTEEELKEAVDCDVTIL